MTMLQTLNRLNIQSDLEAFATVGIHLITQDEKARNDSGCSYRGISLASAFDDDEELRAYQIFDPIYWDGTSCAVGCLVKDDFYNPEMEENPVIENIVLNVVEASNPNWDINDRSVYMMQSLQTVHDNIDVNDWPLYIRALYEIFFIEDERLSLIANDLFSKYDEKAFSSNEVLAQIDKVVKLYPADGRQICKDWALTHLWGIFDGIHKLP